MKQNASTSYPKYSSTFDSYELNITNTDVICWYVLANDFWKVCFGCKEVNAVLELSDDE